MTGKVIISATFMEAERESVLGVNRQRAVNKTGNKVDIGRSRTRLSCGFRDTSNLGFPDEKLGNRPWVLSSTVKEIGEPGPAGIVEMVLDKGYKDTSIWSDTLTRGWFRM